MRVDGIATPIQAYRSVLLPFLDPLVPGMSERLSSATRLSFADLLLWAVFVGDLPMAECFWHQCMHTGGPDGDPVRMALIAAQVSLRVSRVSQTEANKYADNAEQLEQWAYAPAPPFEPGDPPTSRLDRADAALASCSVTGAACSTSAARAMTRCSCSCAPHSIGPTRSCASPSTARTRTSSATATCR